MASPTNSSQNGGIIGVSNAFTPSATIAELTTSFTASGNFNVQCASKGGTRTGSVLVIAGGGSGGKQMGGGGGAGGLRLLSCQNFSTSTIPIVVGAGGAGAGGPAHPCGPDEGPGNVGVASSFGTPGNPDYILSTGGGAGVHQATSITNGRGGSGGGGTNSTPDSELSSNGNTPPTSPAQGNPGGNNPGPNGGGGGGGASAAGSNANSNTGGAGGAGSPVTSIFGSSPQPFYGPTNGVYAGGGGGSYDARYAGGAGGAGSGGGSAGVGPGNSAVGVVNSGSGTGGGGYGSGTGGSGNAGSGRVLIKENSASIPASAPGVWSMQSLYSNVRAGTWTN